MNIAIYYVYGNGVYFSGLYNLCPQSIDQPFMGHPLNTVLRGTCYK